MKDVTEKVLSAGDERTIRTLQDLSEGVVYLMGFSFVVGSLFTILILIMLDVMRRNSISKVQ